MDELIVPPTLENTPQTMDYFENDDTLVQIPPELNDSNDSTLEYIEGVDYDLISSLKRKRNYWKMGSCIRFRQHVNKRHDYWRCETCR